MKKTITGGHWPPTCAWHECDASRLGSGARGQRPDLCARHAVVATEAKARQKEALR